MSLATAPPMRLDLSLRTNDDHVVPARWLHVDKVTPIAVTSAVLTLSFGLPGDDTWLLDEITGLPVEPERQTHSITATTPGTAGGWIDATRFSAGEVVVRIPHDIWAGYLPPLRGRWDLVAVSIDDIQRPLLRGQWVTEVAT